MTIHYLICILLDIITIAVVPVNLFCINMPEYLSIIFSLLIVVDTVMLWRKKSKKSVGKVIISVINTIVILGIVFATYCNPFWNSICLKDAHTYVKGIYPEIHYLKYIEQHNQNKEQLVKINGVDVDEVFEQHKDLYSYEDKTAGISAFYNHICNLEGLIYLGIPVEDKIEYTYETEEGTEKTYEYRKEDFVTYSEYAAFNHLENKDENSRQSFVRYEIDEAKKLAILTLDACEYNEDYKNCIKEMFMKIKELGIENVAVDLRKNGGGYSTVANEFFRYLDIDSYQEWGDTLRLGWFSFTKKAHEVTNKKYKDFMFDGKLYLLTSAETFSAAMDFAEYVKDNHMGTIIGQASSNSPSGYNDITKFALPNSKIYMSISMKKCERIDQTCKDFLVEPDIPCKPNLAIDKLYEAIGQ